MPSEKIIIIGANGMLGQEICKQFGSHDYDIVKADLDNCENILDITDQSHVMNFIGRYPQAIIINCAAWTDVDGAERNEPAALAVNADGPGNLARAAVQNHNFLVHISTDYVFDGRAKSPRKPEDVTDPQNAYGRGKLAGEKAIEKLTDNFLIVRTSWLVGGKGKNFVDTIIDAAKNRQSIKVVDDQIGCPTFVSQLAKCLISLIEKKCRGIYHFCNLPVCSWYELAAMTIKLADIDCQVMPCSSEEYPRAAKRPSYSVLDCTKTLEQLDWKPVTWQEALRLYLLENSTSL